MNKHIFLLKCLYYLIAARKRQLEEIHIKYFQTAKEFYDNQNQIFTEKKNKLALQIENAELERDVIKLKKRKLELEVFQLESQLTR